MSIKIENVAIMNEHKQLMDYMDDMLLKFCTNGATEYQRNKISEIMIELEKERKRLQS